MFKNAPVYAKAIVAGLVYLAGSVPVIIYMTDWRQIVTYLVTGLLSVYGVYQLPNATPVVVPPPAGAQRYASGGVVEGYGK